MELSLEAKEAIRAAIDDLVKQFPQILGVDEIIPGCQVFSLDPFGVGVGVVPRYLEVGLRGTAPAVGSGTGYRVHVLFRGGLTLAVGDYVTVVHMRDADRYEVLTAGGAAGSLTTPAPVDAQYLVLALNATLTNERRLDPLAWLGAVDNGAGADYDLSFYPDLPLVIGTGAIPLEYATIQAAITAAAAGQTVLIPPGTYAEDITLKSGVLVVGWGAREDIRITGDENIVTTASGGHLENVTVDADAPAGGANRGAVLFNSAGTCTLRGVRIEMTSNTNATGACGILTSGANAGTLDARHGIEIIVSTNQAAATAVGVYVTGTYNLYLADFLIEATNTSGGAAFAIGVLTAGTGVVETRHGKITVGGAPAYSYYSAGTAPLIYSVEHDDETIFGRVDYAEGDRHAYVNNRTVTVGAGLNFATIREAIDWFKTVIVKGTCYIDVGAGTYTEAVNISGIVIAPNATLTIRGDLRVLAGLSYVDGATANGAGLANGGSGVCALAIDGTRTIITVTGTVSNPDFDVDPWVNGDTILCHCDDGAVYERIISATLNNTITITVALPAGATLGNDGTAICLLPNRRIYQAAADVVTIISEVGIQFDGIFVKSGAGIAIHCQAGTIVTVANNLATQATSAGIYLDRSRFITAAGAISMWGAGATLDFNSEAFLGYAAAVDGTYGFYAYRFSMIYCRYAIASSITTGYRSVYHSLIDTSLSFARVCTTGYYAQYHAYITAMATNANNTSTTPYSPAASDTLGNSLAGITWS